MTIPADNPIRSIEDDTIGRDPAARSFAQQVLAIDAREGAVLGVLGPWGSGKTSFVNLARVEIDKAHVPVLDFNPWMFSGAQQLVESFFVELASQLKFRRELADVGKGLEDYGEAFSGLAWLPFGTWIERGRLLLQGTGKIFQRRREGVGERREKLKKALRKLDKPIVVVLDDIDRLTTSEIRDVFKLVRLTASFPNIVYVVAFDRKRVEEALAEQGVRGRDYLEKILQVVVDLPAIPSQVLNRQVFTALDGALDTIEKKGPFDQQAWSDLFIEIVRPLIRNMRDVRRYAAAVHGTVGALDGQIALADVLALEAVRIFLPDVFEKFHGAVDGLTATSDFSSRGRSEPPQLKAQVDGLIEAAGEHGQVVRDMIERLFPAGERHAGGSHYGDEWKGRWLRERRVAHEDILGLYLERVAGESLLAFKDAEQAWAHMADRDALERYLRSLDPGRLEEVIGSLECYEDQFASQHVVPGTTVLLNLLPGLPVRQRGMFEMDTRLVVTRVTYRLLRSLKDPVATEAAVRQILPELKTLSAKLELIGDVGHREGRGHKLVSEAAAAEFGRTLRAEVRAAAVKDLAKETDLWRLLLVAKREAEPGEPLPQVADEPQLTLALLRSARSETRKQGADSRAVHRLPRLAWDVLVELYGDEAMLKKRIEDLRATKPVDAGDLLDLAEKYLGGWRPTDFGDD